MLSLPTKQRTARLGLRYMNTKLRTKIDEFLQHRRKSEAGGWAKITNDDVTKLEEIIRLLIEAKCKPDSEGERPIEFMLINRRTHHSMNYCALPYDAWIRHDDADLPPPATADEIMDLAMLNLGLASGDVTQQYRQQRHDRTEAAQRAKSEPKPRADDIEDEDN